MFGLSKRDRVGEALRRGATAALTGAFLHPSEIERLGLNNEASSWIYTESLAHQIFALGLIYSNSPFSTETWSDASFFNRNVSNAITDYETENRMTPGSINSVIFNRIDQLIQIYQRGPEYAHIQDSVTRVTNADPNADRKVIFDRLKTSTEEFMRIAGNMFQ